GMDIQTLEIRRDTAIFDIAVRLWDCPDGLRGGIEYSTDLFDASTIRRMIGHFGTLLEAVGSDPMLKVGDLPLITDTEKKRVLSDWNSRAGTIRDGCVHTLVEAEVDRSPNALAVKFHAGSLTYSELERRANKLAWYLRTLGVGPEVLVGIAMERSDDLVIALLAVLKAGGAYLPLDIAYPRE